MRGFFLAWLLLVSVLTAPAVAGESAPGITLGSVAMDIPAVMFQRLKPLANYLTNQVGRTVQVKPAPDLSVAASEVASGNVDIAYLTPMAYVKAQRDGNVRVVAKMVTKGRGDFRLMIVTRIDSPIRSLPQLAGKRFAFGDPAALLQRAVVVNAGVPLEQLGAYRFLGHYDNIARGILNGDFDAGILKDTSAYQWEKKGLRILYASPELPPYNIAVSRKLEPVLVNAIQSALLRLDPANPAHLAIIKAMDPNYDGFVAANDADYDIIRTLVRPFEQ
jgi:phosphonate transport system substrate-binding protein